MPRRNKVLESNFDRPIKAASDPSWEILLATTAGRVQASANAPDFPEDKRKSHRP